MFWVNNHVILVDHSPSLDIFLKRYLNYVIKNSGKVLFMFTGKESRTTI